MRSAQPTAASVALFALLSRALVHMRFDRLAAYLERQPVGDAADVTCVSELIERALASRLPLFRHTCLTRSVTRYRFLRRAGADVQLVFGVGEIDGAFRGHCWLLRDGEPYLEDVDPRPLFTRMYQIPRDGRA